MNEGYVIGKSQRCNGTTDLGTAVWVADATTGTTTRLGFFSSEFTSSGTGTLSPGYQFSELKKLDGGYAIGTSMNYSIGTTSWLANLSTGEITRPGFADSTASIAMLLDHGWVAGLCPDGGPLGIGGAWVTNASTGDTVMVGLTGGAFQVGANASTSEYLQEGFVAGNTVRVTSGGSYWGRGTWLADNATGTTHRIGFFDTAYTRPSDGFQLSGVSNLQDGMVGGYSYRYNGAEAFQAVAWVAPVTTRIPVVVGLSGTEFGTGSQVSSSIKFLAPGKAVGQTGRYNGTANAGTAAWYADVTTGQTTRIGYYDALHTTENGYQSSQITMRAGRFVAGYSTRYGGVGQTGWVYDMNTQTTYPVLPTLNPPYTNASATVTKLLDSGTAVGTYAFYDANGAVAGYRAFVWTPAEGARDLGSAVQGGLNTAGFKNLDLTPQTDAQGRIAGYAGLLAGTGNSSGAYLLRRLSQFPEIAVEAPPGSNLVSGSTPLDFGSRALSSTAGTSIHCRITNSGPGTLEGLAATITGVAATDFTISALPTTTVAPGGSLEFDLTFQPSTTGSRDATLSLANNDADENPFVISLHGTGLTEQDSWRQQYFGTTANSGDAADAADPDGDGSNYFEFIAGTIPTDPTSHFSVQIESVAGQSTQKAIVFGPVVAGRTYTVKYNDTLAGDGWTTLTNSTIMNVGTSRTVTDLSSANARFYRVEISRP